MPWTPTITNKQLNNGQVTITVQFNSSTTGAIATQQFQSGDIETLKLQIATAGNYFEKNENFANSLPTGSINITPATILLSQTQIDENSWMALYKQLVKVKQTLIDTGVINISNPTYTVLLASVQAGLKAAYFNTI